MCVRENLLMDLHTFIQKSTSKIQPFFDSVMFFKQEVSVVTLGVTLVTYHCVSHCLMCVFKVQLEYRLKLE